jgi:hypothetical protein
LPVSDATWTRVQSELGIDDATLATLLGCSAEEVEQWRTGNEPTPDAVESHLGFILDQEGRWHDALVDRPKATRILPWGRLSTWLTPLLLVAVLLPFALLVSSFLLGFTFTPVPWLGEGLLLATGVISMRMAGGLMRLTGPRCSLCGESVRRRDRTCSGCQAELS